MRRHYSNYLKGLPGIKEFRNRLVTLKTIEEVEAVLDEVQKNYQGYTIERSEIVLENYHEHCAIWQGIIAIERIKRMTGI